MRPLPEGLEPYRRTPDFTEATVPAGLLKDHKTKPGVWGVIHVTAGRLRYAIPSRNEEVELHPGLNGIIEPEVLHKVMPFCAVTFYVEFWR
jgi:tellurite resistance-related uncharacterized protein